MGQRWLRRPIRQLLGRRRRIRRRRPPRFPRGSLPQLRERIPPNQHEPGFRQHARTDGNVDANVEFRHGCSQSTHLSPDDAATDITHFLLCVVWFVACFLGWGRFASLRFFVWCNGFRAGKIDHRCLSSCSGVGLLGGFRTKVLILVWRLPCFFAFLHSLALVTSVSREYNCQFLLFGILAWHVGRIGLVERLDGWLVAWVVGRGLLMMVMMYR